MSNNERTPSASPTPPRNRRGPKPRATVSARTGAAPAERRDEVFGAPAPLWELVAWYVSTRFASAAAPAISSFTVSDEWFLFVNPTPVPQPIEPDGNPQGLKCGPGEALACRNVSGWGPSPVLRIRRNRVWALTDGTQFEQELETALRAALRAAAEAGRAAKNGRAGGKGKAGAATK